MNAAESEKRPAKTGKRQPTLFSVVNETLQPHDRNGRPWRELTNSITYWIAKYGLPLYVIEKSGYKIMIHTYVIVFDPISTYSYKIYDQSQISLVHTLKDRK